MQDANYNTSFEDEDAGIDIKELVMKYVHYWPYFIAAGVLAFVLAITYLRYTPTIYSTQAKIKIIDNTNELNIAAEAMSLFKGKSNVNLDNEIEIMKSYRLLSLVVEELNLHVDYLVEGNIKTMSLWEAPFKIVDSHTLAGDSVNKTGSYTVKWDANQFYITNIETTQTYTQSKLATTPVEGLFFYAKPNATQLSQSNKEYKVVIKPFKQTVMGLASSLGVQPANKNSDILTLSLKGTNTERSEAIINEVIDKFNADGIEDRQLVSRNTLNFIDERFMYLSQELDSIEGDKSTYKQENNLSYIGADAQVNLQKKSESEAELFRIETQIEIANLLRTTLAKEAAYQLLPANIGLESASINNLIDQYNQSLLNREKLLASAGTNNPTVRVLNTQIVSTRANIQQTLSLFAQQLKISLAQIEREKGRAGAQFSSLPEKEQLLRAIERQQSIKENLYLILLQKREEAAISLAVTAPSIKVVDYALSSSTPVAPNRKVILLGAIVLGLLIPFGILYIIFLLDTKIHTRQDVEAAVAPIPVIGEIPFIENSELFLDPDARSTVAETFRILMTNVDYALPQIKDNKAKVIYVTSTIKGEGKTYTAVNLALASASLGKRVLIIGADIRNPQLHNFFNLKKNTKGLTTFLFEPSVTAKDIILRNKTLQSNLDIIIAGAIPPNPASLLGNGRFETLLNELKPNYDFIVVDTAPTILVTDTLLISGHADVTVYMTKADFTDKHLLKIPQDLGREEKLHNIVLVINTIGKGDSYYYGYGYGYGYVEDIEKKVVPWYKRLWKW